ncbi:MAG: hypothetical protein GWP05_03555 [Anaerolineaceae bacterium]|nr:hypothetical protein [Anaerolineaceae bacterium]
MKTGVSLTGTLGLAVVAAVVGLWGAACSAQEKSTRRPNVDLRASWYLYHIAIAYDILYDELSEGERKVIRDGLAAHAKAIYEDFDQKNKKIRFDQTSTRLSPAK